MILSTVFCDMVNLLLLFVSLITGILLRQFNLVSLTASKDLNQLLVYFFIPALTLLHIPATQFSAEFFLPIFSSWLVYLFSGLFFLGITKWQQFDKNTLAALIMTSGIGSTSFVGFPIFELIYGAKGLEIGILMSIAGTMLVCMTLGIATGVWFSSKALTVKHLFTRMLKFPPFIAFIIALGLNFSNYSHPVIIQAILQKISSPYSIIALLTIGLQINFSLPKAERKPLSYGLFYKLLLAPLIIYWLLTTFTNANKMIIEIAVLGAAIGSMNLVAIIASQMGLNPPLASKMVGIGIPISLFTMYLIHLLFQI